MTRVLPRGDGQAAVRTGPPRAFTGGELEVRHDGLFERVGEDDLVEAAVDREAVGEVPRVRRGVGARRHAVAARVQRPLFDDASTAVDLHDGAGDRSRQQLVEIDDGRRPAVDVECEPQGITIDADEQHAADHGGRRTVGDHDLALDPVEAGGRHTRAEPRLGQPTDGWRRRHPTVRRDAERRCGRDELGSCADDDRGEGRQEHEHRRDTARHDRSPSSASVSSTCATSAARSTSSSSSSSSSSTACVTWRTSPDGPSTS